MIAALVLILVAVVVAAVLLCFIKRTSAFYLPLALTSIVALVCAGLTSASYKNAFDGYSILLIISVLPLFLTIFEFKTTNKTADNISQEGKKLRFGVFNLDKTIKGFAYCVSAFCIAFYALYLGKETPYSFLIGLFLALACTFLDFIITKNSLLTNLFGFFEKFLMFLAASLLVSTILPCLLYSFALQNILFSLACACYASHIILNMYLPNKFNNLSLFASFLLLFASIVF